MMRHKEKVATSLWLCFPIPMSPSPTPSLLVPHTLAPGHFTALCCYCQHSGQWHVLKTDDTVVALPCLGCEVVGGKSCELPRGDHSQMSGAWARMDCIVLYILATRDCLTCNFYSSLGACLLESSNVRSPLGHMADLEVFVGKQLS